MSDLTRPAAERDDFEADRSAWAEERRELIALIRTHERERARLAGQLTSEQAYMRREFAAGADELKSQLETVRKLRRRIKRLESQLGFYRGSRLIRLTERIVRRARRIRSRK
jgi:hypothetical protein